MSLGIEEEGVSERNEEDDELDDYMMDDEEVFDNSEKDGDVGIDGSNSNRHDIFHRFQNLPIKKVSHCTMSFLGF